MKKTIITLFICLLGLLCSAQKITEYRAKNGIIYRKGDTVKLGSGSAPNGDFRYLQMGGWVSIVGFDSAKGSDQNNIGKGYSGTAVVIKNFDEYKIKGAKKAVFIVGGGNITNYRLLIDDAIDACEVIPCKSTSVSVLSVADELIKLKQLLDAGALTPKEFDDQKKKLLDK